MSNNKIKELFKQADSELTVPEMNSINRPKTL